MPKSKNIRLTPVQRDTLWSVEEGGTENLWTVWITVRGAHQAMPNDHFRAEFVEGLLGLSRRGYVRLIRGLYGSGEAEPEITQEESELLWLGEMRDVSKGVFVEMTGAGYEALGQPGGTLLG